MGQIISVNGSHMRVFFDIETVPPDETARAKILAEVEREMDAEESATGEQIQRVADERFRRLALCGEQGRVLVIGMIFERGMEVIKRCLIGCDSERRFHLDEARTLRRFWASLRDFDCRHDLLIGHNIYDFDLPFLYKRSIICKVRPSLELSFARYRSQPIFDTICEWEKWGRGRISLDRLAKVLGLESSKTAETNGSSVYDHFIAGRHKEVADYCGRDVELVRAIYYRMKFLEMPTAKPGVNE